jgi:hypothetical protein
MDSFNYCRHYINRYLAGESFSYKEIPAAISSTSLNITPSGLRDSRSLTADGIFRSSNTDQGLFGSVFTGYAPGSGPTSWGGSIDECDWLGRCGGDKPADWHF